MTFEQFMSTRLPDWWESKGERAVTLEWLCGFWFCAQQEMRAELDALPQTRIVCPSTHGIRKDGAIHVTAAGDIEAQRPIGLDSTGQAHAAEPAKPDDSPRGGWF